MRTVCSATTTSLTIVCRWFFSQVGGGSSRACALWQWVQNKFQKTYSCSQNLGNSDPYQFFKWVAASTRTNCIWALPNPPCFYTLWSLWSGLTGISHEEDALFFLTFHSVNLTKINGISNSLRWLFWWKELERISMGSTCIWRFYYTFSSPLVIY